MIERLALPSWNAPPASLDAWLAQLRALGHEPEIVREPGDLLWIEVKPLRIRGYVVPEGESLAAINFEMHAEDPLPALKLLEDAAKGLSWELHDEDDEEDPEQD